MLEDMEGIPLGSDAWKTTWEASGTASIGGSHPLLFETIKLAIWEGIFIELPEGVLYIGSHPVSPAHSQAPFSAYSSKACTRRLA